MKERLKSKYCGLFDIETDNDCLSFTLLSDDFNSLNHAILDDLDRLKLDYDYYFDIDDYDQKIAIITVSLDNIKKLLDSIDE